MKANDKAWLSLQPASFELWEGSCRTALIENVWQLLSLSSEDHDHSDEGEAQSKKLTNSRNFIAQN